MKINNPADTSSFSIPRAKVLLNKKEVIWHEVEINNTSYYNADTFNIEIPLFKNTVDWTLDKFASEQKIDVEIDISLDGGINYTPNFYGKVDQIDFDIASNLLKINGRDYSSDLIDTKTTERYPNSTSSQIAIKFAKNHNLTPIVTNTKTPIGVYLNNEYVQTGIQKSEWDILTFLAQKENFLLFVRKDELHFQPKPQQGDDYYSIEFKIDDLLNKISCNSIRPSFERSLTIAKDIKVHVISFNHSTGKTIKKTATKSRKNPQEENVQSYVFSRPNLTSEQALQMAQSYLQQLTDREIILRCSLFFDNTLDITNPIIISGTNSKLDQIYYISKIVRTLTFEGEMQMEIEAKNHSVESEVSIL